MTPVENTQGAAATLAAPGAASNAAKSAPDEAQDRFLKLLVTQLKNQDPLNPMDNAQMTSQLAQISTVSGLDKLNATLQSIAANFSAGQSLQAAAMIGRNVLVPGNQLELANGKARGGADLPQSVDRVVVSVRDGSGRVVHAVDMGPHSGGAFAFEWDGVADDGSTAASGYYSFKVEAVQGGKTIDAAALAFGQVAGVTQDKAGVSLIVSGVGPVRLSDVRQIQ